MSATKNLLAVDLGAESGRAALGHFDGETICLEEVHRFVNTPVRTLDSLHWDALRLHADIVEGIRRAGRLGEIASVGIDTWGVDFALLGKGDVLLGNPRHYRDPHTEGTIEQTFGRVPAERIFQETGIQFLRINTLFQLLALARDGNPLLESARALLMMPDLFHFWLTGIRANELTNATTTQMYNPMARAWARELVQDLGLPAGILGTLSQPGTVLGPLRASVASEAGVSKLSVIVPATHDTASAVAAVPAQGDSWAYISSGTWSLMGVELPAPLINEEVRHNNFTNEGGYGETTRFLKNIMGLWLVQECRRAWERAGRSYSYEELTQLAGAAPAHASLVNPDDPAFLLPADMTQAIAESCRQTGQAVPTDPGAFVRCALESLALRYRWTLDRLEEDTGRKYEVIHVVGGGSQNVLLCQLTADACNRPVVAGPVEATAIGNVLVQAIGLNLIGSLADARSVVRRSFAPRTYTPRAPHVWQEPYARFLRLPGVSGRLPPRQPEARGSL